MEASFWTINWVICGTSDGASNMDTEEIEISTIWVDRLNEKLEFHRQIERARGDFSIEFHSMPPGVGRVAPLKQVA